MNKPNGQAELMVAQVLTVTPMTLIERAAADPTFPIEKLQQLFELKLRVEADEAKKAFHEAFTEFKAEPIRIVKDKENLQFSKPGKPAMYASIENMVATVTPFLSKHGLSHNWQVNQSNGISVTCTITHTLGHSIAVEMSGPPDDSGAKNKLQQIKSTVTYLKIATLESACGLASEYGSLSDDGNGAGKASLDDEDFISLRDAILDAPDDEALKKRYLTAVEAAKEIGDEGASRKFGEAKNTRYRKLHGGVR